MNINRVKLKKRRKELAEKNSNGIFRFILIEIVVNLELKTEME